MAEIRPFRGLRYATPRLDPVLSPPYDVIDEAERDALEARDPHNVVRLELEKERPGDGGAETRYSRSARWLEEWRAQGVLVRDPRPALYALEQRFTVDGEPHVRRGFFARLRLHPFADGVVLPHERTLSAPKADRLALLEAVRANVSPIFGLFPDDDGAVTDALAGALGRAPDAEGRTANDGVEHRLFRLEGGGATARLEQLLAPKRITIADGHHRYETALAYAERRLAEGAPAEGAHRYVLAFLCATSDPGLRILPTHRLVFGLPSLDPGRFFTLLDEHFEVRELEEDVRKPAGRAWALRKLAEAGRDRHALLALSRGDRKARLLVLKEGLDLAHVASLPKNPTLRALDVTLLHGLVLQGVLGLSPESQARKENLAYVKDAGEAIEAVLGEGGYPLGFLLNPTPMWQVRAVAEAGEVMPQKSTFFFPKIPTGLVLNVVDPADPA